jgi:AraC-like DNA-binding protein
MGYNDYETFYRASKKHFHISPDDLKSIVERIKMDLHEEGWKESS